MKKRIETTLYISRGGLAKKNSEKTVVMGKTPVFKTGIAFWLLVGLRKEGQGGGGGKNKVKPGPWKTAPIREYVSCVAESSRGEEKKKKGTCPYL